MSNADPRGRFVWHELLTTDAAAATAFYPKVVPWKPQAWERDPTYTLWVANGVPIGGLATLTDESATSRWVAYVGVDDVPATVARARDLGATVVTDATDIPDVGTYAMLKDPQGAEFAIYKSATDGSALQSGPGTFSWHELCTTDAEAAVRFYTELFGWNAGGKHQMGDPMGFYHLFQLDGADYGGIYQMENMPAAWMCYVKVPDAGKAAAAAKAAGGRVINGPMEVPGGSWIAQVLDPVGVAFAVHEEPAAAQAKPAAAKKAKAPKTAAAATESVGAAPSTAAANSDAVDEEEEEATPAPRTPAKKSAKKSRSQPAAAAATTETPAAEASLAGEEEAAAPARRRTGTRRAAGRKKASGQKTARKKAPAKKAAGKKAASKGARRKTAAGRPARKSGRKSAGRSAAKAGKTARKSTRGKAAGKRPAAKKGRRTGGRSARGRGGRRSGR